MRILMCVVLLATAACANSPTAPSRADAVAAQLRWDVTSSSCAATALPQPLPDINAANIRQQGDGSVMASWPYDVSGRSVTLYARFVRENGAWAMCSWETADI